MYKSKFFCKAVNKLLLWFRMCYDLFVSTTCASKKVAILVITFGLHSKLIYKDNSLLVTMSAIR